MATIQAAIKLYDGMTPALKSINNAMRSTITACESMQRSSSRAFDAASIRQARAELANASAAVDRIEHETNQATTAQKNYNTEAKKTNPVMSGLGRTIGMLAAQIAVAFSVSKIIEWSDAVTQTKARLDLINDGTQTTAALQDKVLQSANRSRGSYQDMADAVTKIGMNARDAFSSNDEIIKFVEQLNKQFVISGASTQEMQSATLQLTQALASGVLRGDELVSVGEQAPGVIQSIADYLNVPKGKIREMAAEGQITADIVKNAMFAAANETNAQFEKMSMTFGQMWTLFQNKASAAFKPVFERIGALASSSEFQNTLDKIINTLVNVANGAITVIDIIINNWPTIKPILLGLAGAIAAVKVQQLALNFALNVSPITWIAMAIGVVIMLVWQWVDSMGGIENAWRQVTSWIQYAIDVIWSGLQTFFAWVQENAGYVALGFLQVGYAIQNAFLYIRMVVMQVVAGIVNSVIDAVNFIIEGLQAIGVQVEKIANVDWGTSAVDDYNNSVNESANVLSGMEQQIINSAKTNYGYANSLYEAANANYALRQAEIDRAKAAGYSSSMPGGNRAKASFDVGGNNKTLSYSTPAPNTHAYSGGSKAVDAANKLNRAVKETAENTSKMVDSMEITKEDVKYLRDAAERKAINRFTTATIKVDMINNNNIKNKEDVDGIISALESKLYEKLNSVAEGVHI